MDYQAQGHRQKKQSPQKKQQELSSEHRRAKIKALKLLERMDRTEAQLREKLLQAEFAPELVEEAVAYVKSYGYLDDERYVRNYIEYRKDQKSRRQLTQELQFKKGVSPELIQKVYEELEPSDEKCMIRRHLEKKHYRPSESDEKQKQKLIAPLARKGFRIGDILSVMREWPEEEQNFQ